MWEKNVLHVKFYKYTRKKYTKYYIKIYDKRIFYIYLYINTRTRFQSQYTHAKTIIKNIILLKDISKHSFQVDMAFL